VSQEKVLKTLVSLGLTRLDAKVYILLAKRGPIKARDATKALKIPKQRLYPIIKNLQSKGIVNSTLERPARFSAVEFEKVLDLFLKAKMEQAQRMRQNMDELLSDWKSIVIAESDSAPAKFTVIEGRAYVYSKIQQMIQETKEQMSFVATVPSLARADQFGLFDAAFNHPSRSKIQFRFLTELSEQNANALKTLLKKKPRVDFHIEGRAPDLGLKLCPRMVIRDEEEAVFFIDPRQGEVTSEQDDVCLWTNCESLVHGFLVMFEDLWRNSTDIEKKIVEIETGKPSPKTHIISDAKTAYKTYDEALHEAQEEIILTTSSKGLAAFWKGLHFVKQWVKRGVSIKIMAPIVSENIEAAQQLLKFCDVRHVPPGYLGTTIIDGKQLFEFKNPPPSQEKLGTSSHFENTFHTNDHEYVEKTGNMLNNIWRSAYVPSAITLEAITKMNESTVDLLSKIETRELGKIVGLTIKQEKKSLGLLTEKSLLTKIINAQRIPAEDLSKDIVRLYGSAGQAVIHPPDYFNLPHLLFQFLKMNKKSSFGAEDAMIISSRLETPTGYSYLPAVFITDNPESVDFWEKTFAGFPFKQILVKKDELLLQIQHNTLFAGWTVSIPLSHTTSILPPSSIMIEGYGNVKAIRFIAYNPSGTWVINELNRFEAFVTFMHPSTKYTGPGTDGYFGREYFSATYPPSTSKQN
jgi:sugar-specific transcriptional regulator TrmB